MTIPPLVCWALGGHSNQAEADFIAANGFLKWYLHPPFRIAESVAAAWKLGYQPVLMHRFPGAEYGGPGGFNVTLRHINQLAGTDWASFVKRITMPAFWTRKRLRYALYMPALESGSYAEYDTAIDLIISAGPRCEVVAEGVTDSVRRAAARSWLRGHGPLGCEPFYDKANPITAENDPCVVLQETLDGIGADMTGKGWPPNWFPIGADQRRTLIANDKPLTRERLNSAQAYGWVPGAFCHRVAEFGASI